MKSKILIAWIVAGLFFVVFAVFAQRKPSQQSENTIEPKFSFTTQTVQLLQSGFDIKEISKPDLILPKDINEGQIKKYFKIDNILFALVLRSSTNVVLSLPANFTTSFSGVLVAKQGDARWFKLLEITDVETMSKNNPYYLVVDNKELLLTVVDQNGAGSGEGMMKVYALSETTNWGLEGCFYFGASYNDLLTDGDYFAFSTIFSKQVPQAIRLCNSVKLISNE
ncbi:MAG: hypothetical protein WCV83_01700 [Candidatus Magasanikbacteria bacterium]|jgi:hypothetical protein